MPPSRYFLLFLVLAVTPALYAKTYTVAGNYQVYVPPFFWRDHCTQQPRGFGWQLQRHLWKDLGVEFAPLHLSLTNESDTQQLYQRMQRGEIDVFQSMPPTENRVLSTTKEPFFDPASAVFHKKNSPWQYRDWASLKNKNGGWVSPNGFDLRSMTFQNYARDNLKMTAYSSYQSGFDALSHGEIDYILTYRAVGAAVIKHYGYDEVSAATTKGISRAGYLAIAKNSPLAARSDEIDTLLRHYKQAGLLQVLLQLSMSNWLESRNDDCAPSPPPRQ